MLLGTTIVVSVMLSELSAAPPLLNNITFTGNPTGPCFPRCACQDKGRYFGEGERWTDIGDQCTVYECTQSGNIVSMYTGCLFKGVCKDMNSNWTDDCITYTCLQGQQKAFFTPLEVGCKTQDGSCRGFGQTSIQGCDTSQCQFVGGMLKMNLISTGCVVDGRCRPENSYWHDGCTIHKCIRRNGVTKPRTRKQDIMYWPDGNYALFKTKTGCPVDIQKNWADGYRKHYGNGQNFFPKEPSLAGQFMPDFFAYEFCTHKSNGNRRAGTKRYNTYWEPGNYCIFRRQGRCPRGFLDGFLLVDDNDSKSYQSDLQGSVPDGVFDTDTGFHFCCRSDGDSLQDIILPKENSFALLMGGDAAGCQSVKGMQVSEERYTIDGALFSQNYMNGSLPMLQLNDGDVTLSVCIYMPQQCGCPDGSGKFIPVNTQRTTNCVQKRCVSNNGTLSLEMIQGGCNTDGGCKAENSIWSVIKGESCTKQTCRRVTDIKGTRFEVEHMFKGCRDGEMCFGEGTELYRDCATTQCVKDQQTQNHVFKTIQSDCPWSGICQPVNSTWQHGCMTYKCENTYTDNRYEQWNIEPVDYGCRDNTGNCYKVGETIAGQCYEAVCKISSNKSVVYMDVVKGGCTWKNICKEANESWQDGCHSYQCQWVSGEKGFSAVINATTVSCEWKGKCYNESEIWTERCIEYKCRVRRDTEEVNWSVETVKLGCKDFRGKCVTLGKNITERCVTYECKKWGDRLGLDPVSVGCRWKGKCRLENSTWQNKRKCVTYQCKKKTGSKGAMMQISVVDYGCSFNGSCKKVNSTWPDGCRTRKCVVTRTNKMITRSVAPVSAGCDDEGLCRPVGYKKVSNSCMEYECLFNDELKDAYFTLSSGACRSIDNTCHKVNTTWTDKTSDMCLNYECRREPVGFLSKMVEQQCRDANGVCQSIGSEGFPAEVNGLLKSDCKCVQTFESNSNGIAVQCKP